MNKKLPLPILVVLSMAVFDSCKFTNKVESPKYERMLERRLPINTPYILVSEVDDEKQANTVFLDTREREEYEVSHIENALFVGYKDIDLSEVLKLPKDTSIIVYCSVGYRSGKVTKDLLDEGYTNVLNLYGGIFEWSNQQRTLVDMNGQVTQNIHPYNERWGKWLTNGVKSYE